MLKIVGVICVAFFCSGCAVPLLTGVKEIQTAGGTRVSFITGGDFRIGANGLDTIDDNRGIKPGGGYQAARAQEKY